ncbi:oligopeptide ABC transporter ATP-binding protein OppF [Spiroplasma taiwanense]|uniref:Oligopeptide ABC transporter ATP-binding protein n=1 Tax=Spiroplasma taiwanense CT-1 TaxID=1276220 RepID=S5LUJ1_9MOLU|nr:oligopeptide ABC transporter ATP-binding protein OppF [Spiroplasma taiwanense]AGR41464.1 oligopeptide ABC transporter ATP-binding protein [Spiroplasma taiwanense CT-1]
MSNREELLNVRDIVVQFRNRSKKNTAVSNVSFDIYKGEVFGLVGESGSGKTTIGRAIAGVQQLKDGAIYLESQIIAGTPTSLFKLNKKITKKLKEMNLKIDSLLLLFNEFIELIDIKLISDDYYLEKISEEKIKNALKFLEQKNKILVLLISKNLKAINSILINFDRINKFIMNIDSYIPEVPKELEKAIISKNNETKNSVIFVKDNLVSSYEYLLNILELFKEMLSKSNNLESISNSYLIRILENIKSVSNFFTNIVENYKKIVNLEEQNLALSSPLRKRNKISKKYYDLVFIRRELFYEEILKQLNLLLKSNISDNKEIEKLNFYLKDFWSKSNMNLASINKIFKLINKNNYTQNQINSLLNSLKQTEFELSLKSFLYNNSKVDLLKLKEYKKEYEYILKIIKNDILKDEESIQSYLNWKPEKKLLEGLEKEEILKFINFLELPSIDELVTNSFLFRKRIKKEKWMNRKNTQVIFQDPGSSLNDKMSISEILSEGIDNFSFLYKSKEAKQEFLEKYNAVYENKITLKDIKSSKIKNDLILELIKSVGLSEEHLSRYPHEFSGGQKQRIGIARALSLKPKIIIADEPISALDVSIRAQVLNLFKKFREQFDLTYLFITHDLSVVKYFADRIAVIYKGKIVELAESEELFKNPLHPYTKSLLSAIPIPDPDLSQNRKLLVYNYEKEHFDYEIDIPYFKEVSKNHFVYGNQREFKKMRNSKNL